MCSAIRTAPEGWTIVHNHNGGVHHVRRELGDGTLLSVSVPRGRTGHDWRWGHYNGDTGRPVAQAKRGTYWSTLDHACAAADRYLETGDRDA